MAAELSISYLGIQLKSPVIVGSCSLAIEPESVRQMVSAGAGAIVLPSIFQEQLMNATMKQLDPIEAIERSGNIPQHDKYNGGPENYLKSIRQLKAMYSVPIIASINGASIGPWLDYAKEIEASGADALELNWQSIVCDPSESADRVESRMCDWVTYLRSSVAIPVAVKLNPRFTNLASISHKLQIVGAKGLVLFAHRPQWNVDIDRMHWTIGWELSPVGMIGGILEGIVYARTGGLNMSIAASGGVCTGEDAIKTMIAGADAVMVVSEIYRKGPDAIRDILAGITQYLNASHYGSLLEFQQARPDATPNSEHFTRLEFVDPLTRSKQYFDPTPKATHGTGDSFGHQPQ